MGRGKFKGKPTGRRHFSTPEEMIIGASASRPRTFKKQQAEVEEDERSREEPEAESEDESQKAKGLEGVIQIENPNFMKQKNLKACDADVEKTTELSRREREVIEKQKAHERFMRLQEQGKTDQARKDLGNGSNVLNVFLSFTLGSGFGINLNIELVSISRTLGHCSTAES
ncbi:uncharacterized protein LOC127254094 isoform X2 [Andrographis paniculata]|uniref:uncharacterized protein LOC127254094 isoform X2 n=1 Tax=Andrographis paniculata TaxID=175694 RepID=UPI0021E7EC14|nr:uncharacterized protein LOC127254094 isoform X2 [Andrographis paniculata]